MIGFAFLDCQIYAGQGMNTPEPLVNSTKFETGRTNAIQCEARTDRSVLLDSL